MRLASEQGLFQRQSLNPFQLWGMTYMMSFKRWFLGEVRNDFLKSFLVLTDPRRYAEVFAPPLSSAFDENELPIDPSEFDQIDSYLDSLDKVRSTSGSEIVADGEWV